MSRLEPFYEQDGVTLYQGDCLEILPSLTADVLITDPDYGVGIDFKRLAPTTGQNVGLKGTRTAGDADALVTAMLRAVNLSRPCGCVFWSGSWTRIQGFSEAVSAADWAIHHLGIWYKPNGAGPSGNGLARRFEPWFWLKQGKAQRLGEWNFLPDCIDVSRVVPGHEEAMAHPTQKPMELMRRLVRFFSQEGDTIIDPFAGSGTTLRAAQELGRKAIGIELNPDYCAIAVERLSQRVLVLPQPDIQHVMGGL